MNRKNMCLFIPVTLYPWGGIMKIYLGDILIKRTVR